MSIVEILETAVEAITNRALTDLEGMADKEPMVDKEDMVGKDTAEVEVTEEMGARVSKKANMWFRFLFFIYH